MPTSVLAKTLDADVLVCGGGVAGVMAAVAAARAGAAVVLVERYGFFGGNATAGAVAQFNSWQTAAGRPVVAGLASEVVQRLREYGGARDHQVFVMSTGHRMDRVEYAPEVLKLVLDDMVAEAGVTPLLHVNVADVTTAAGRIDRVQLLAKGGGIEVLARVVIDASGDMDVLHRAGAAFLELQPGEQLQPGTMMFRFGPIDFAQLDALPSQDVAALARQGFESGALARAALHCARDPFSPDGWFNISRLAVDATDPSSLSAAELQGRRQAWRAAQFLRQSVPGCENGRLLAFGTQVGVRETRRMHGEHVLTGDDLLQPVRFDDAIAAGAYPIDIHPASGAGLVYQPMGEDHSYQIPYRSLVPRRLANVLGIGRGISASHTAHAAIRVMTISMAVGQAAGIAAAMAARSGPACEMRDVDTAQLRAALVAAGACLGQTVEHVGNLPHP